MGMILHQNESSKKVLLNYFVKLQREQDARLLERKKYGIEMNQTAVHQLCYKIP